MHLVTNGSNGSVIWTIDTDRVWPLLRCHQCSYVVAHPPHSWPQRSLWLDISNRYAFISIISFSWLDHIILDTVIFISSQIDWITHLSILTFSIQDFITNTFISKLTSELLLTQTLPHHSWSLHEIRTSLVSHKIDNVVRSVTTSVTTTSVTTHDTQGPLQPVCTKSECNTSESTLSTQSTCSAIKDLTCSACSAAFTSNLSSQISRQILSQDTFKYSRQRRKRRHKSWNEESQGQALTRLPTMVYFRQRLSFGLSITFLDGPWRFQTRAQRRKRLRQSHLHRLSCWCCWHERVFKALETPYKRLLVQQTQVIHSAAGPTLNPFLTESVRPGVTTEMVFLSDSAHARFTHALRFLSLFQHAQPNHPHFSTTTQQNQVIDTLGTSYGLPLRSTKAIFMVFCGGYGATRTSVFSLFCGDVVTDRSASPQISSHLAVLVITVAGLACAHFICAPS